MNYRLPITEALVTTLQGAARLLDQIVIPDFVNMSLPSSALTAAALAHFRATQTEEMLKTIKEKNEALQRLLIKLGWPPPWHLPAITLDRIAEGNASGDLSDEDVTDLFIELYDSKLLNTLLTEWKRSEYLGERGPILEEGTQNHLDKRFCSAVCVFLPQIEGVIADELGRKPNPQNDAGVIFNDSTLSKVAREFYVNMARSSFTPTSKIPAPDLSRYAILHGRDTSFGTASHSLRVILLFDAVWSAIGDRSRARLTNRRSRRTLVD